MPVVMNDQPVPAPPAADRFVLVDMLTATARSLGWVPFSADSSVDRVIVTFTPRPS